MFRLVKVLVVSIVVVLTVSLIAFAAPTSFTIKGRVVDPEGRSVVGAPLSVFPLTPEEGWDPRNLFYKIPNYDFHATVTDENGEFVMENVLDYPGNYTRRYVVGVPGGYKGLEIKQMLNLASGHPVREYVIKAQYAAKMTITLKDRDGQPFNGKKVLFFQSGRGVGDAQFGVSFVTEAVFRDGVFERSLVIKPDRYARVAVLGFETEAQAQSALQAKGLKTGDSLDPLALTMKDAQGRPLSAETTLTPHGLVQLIFQLP